ncbi:glycosyltransferase family 2 protein [Yoonia maritima]|uniref:glycosyltransferase family 2 protein n=1 Tax=Yoonia maritima TaxID=1435347 RepID=UPI00373525D2
MADGQSCTLIGTVKDEGPYLLEWICYYKLIGFDKIAIASNDCNDGSRQMLDYLDTVGEITHLENSGHVSGTNADPQNRAYERLWENPFIKASDWVLVADADEFINIHVGDGSVEALFAALSEITPGRVDLISATWRVFGNSGIVKFEDEPVIAQFDHAAPEGINQIQRYTAFKTMFRPRVARKLSIHRPRLAPRFQDGRQPVQWVNGSGEAMPDRYLKQGWRSFEEALGRDLVSMNHYMIKSSEAFLMKRYRGTANSADQDRIDFSYFETFNANDVEDKSIQRHVPALRKRIEELKREHPHLELLHNRSLEWHRQKLDRARNEIISEAPEIALRLGIV